MSEAHDWASALAIEIIPGPQCGCGDCRRDWEDTLTELADTFRAIADGRIGPNAPPHGDRGDLG